MGTKAVISSTNDSLYSFFIPITAWCWNKLGVRSLVFVPLYRNKQMDLALETAKDWITFLPFEAPEHKQATYAQCARLYAACLGLPEDEYLITSDVDMAVFKIPIDNFIEDRFTILGTDLVPNGQYPVCYCGATVKGWRETFKLYYGALSGKEDSLAELKVKSYQQCLDELLGHIEAEHFRGNFFSKDQEELYNKISKTDRVELPRSNGENQFATKRLDRDDSYIFERQTVDVIDYHMNRPGFECTEIVLTIFQKIYPNENFDWIRNYTEQYKSLL